MVWHSMASLGVATTTRGYELSSKDASNACSEIDINRQINCVHVASLDCLIEINQKMERLVTWVKRVEGLLQATMATKKRSYVEHDHVADGMLSALITTPKAVFIADLDERALSARARKCLCRIKSTGVTLVADLTDDLLAETRNCGVTTAAEIKEWAGIVEVKRDQR